MEESAGGPGEPKHMRGRVSEFGESAGAASLECRGAFKNTVSSTVYHLKTRPDMETIALHFRY